jgi:hypothetical protein
MRLRATAIACHEGAIVTRCFQARSRNDRKHVLRASCFYLEAGNPTLHLGIALAARRTLLRSKFGAMKYLGYAVGAVLLLSAFMRVGSRSHGSDMAHAEAIRSVAEETALAVSDTGAFAPGWLEKAFPTSVRTVAYGNGHSIDGRPDQRELAFEADFPGSPELDLFPDLADENRPSASEMSDLSAHADRHGCANDLPPFPAIFHPWAENDLEEDP